MDMTERFEQLICENERMKVALKPFAAAFDKQWAADSGKANGPISEGGGNWPARKDDDPMTVAYADCQTAYCIVNAAQSLKTTMNF